MRDSCLAQPQVLTDLLCRQVSVIAAELAARHSVELAAPVLLGQKELALGLGAWLGRPAGAGRSRSGSSAVWRCAPPAAGVTRHIARALARDASQVKCNNETQ